MGKGYPATWKRRHFVKSGVSAMAFLASFGPVIVHGQESTSPSAQAQDIIVTGSRIARSGLEAPSPVTVLTDEDIQRLSLSSTSEVVAQIPQNSQFTSSANVGAGNFNIGASLGNLRGLNPFFGTRTLTLVDTRRHVPTTNGGAVDLNAIPSLLIQRVETVTGGASAAYGSEAVAGVINIILDKRLKGLKAQLDYGLTTRGNGGDAHAALAGGVDFADGRGHLVIGGEYQNQQDIGGCAQVRDWCAENNGIFVNAGYATNGQPHFIRGPGGRAYNSSSGLFPFLNMQFNEAGTALVPFVPGNYANPFVFGQSQMQGGADPTQDQFRDAALRPASERYSVLAHGEYELTDSISAFVEGSYYKRSAENIQPGSGASIFFNSISPDNAFLPPAAAGMLAALPPPLRSFTSNGQVLRPKTNNTDVQVWRGVIGLKSDAAQGWNWNAYYTYGRNKVQQRVMNNKVNTFFNFALDAVDDPSTAAFDPACRATLAGPAFNPAAAGCVPLNLFGTGNASPEALSYAYRTMHQDELYQQHVVAGTVNGDLYEGWGAGPIGVAFGAEYRHESITNTHDTENQPWYSAYENSFGQDFQGKLDVVEGFVEVNVPVIKDAPFFKSLAVDGAVRQSHYKNTNGSTGGALKNDFTTWKLSAIWEVNDWVRLRATRSRDARAPGFYELYSQSVATGGFFGTVTNPWAGNTSQAASVVLGGSNEDTGPEKADTWTLGAVLTGHGALEGFYASADWYQVNLNGPISTLGSAQNVVTACFTEGTFCDLVTGTGPVAGGGFANITGVSVPYLNLGSYLTRGWDMELGYRTRISETGSLNFRLIGNYQYDMIVDTGTGAQVRNHAGISGPTAAFGYFNTSPKWQGNAFVTYAEGPFTATVQARYVGPGKFALLNAETGQPYVQPGDEGYSPNSPNSINDNRVDDAVYINLNASLRVPISAGSEQSFELFGSISNLFDKDPSAAPGGNGYPTNPVYFDTFGRTARIGVRIRY